MPNVNTNLHAAKKAKNDEFYTRLEDIENELRHYKAHFRGKTILCNCDDPRVSNFFRYFALNFEAFGLKKLIATCYKSQDADLFSQHASEQAVYIVYEGDKDGNRVPDPSEMQVLPLKGDGDFRSEECIELLKEADIVCTNPPFSLFREYMAQLMKYEKKFIIVANKGAVSYKEIFPLIKDNKLWSGHRPWAGGMWFETRNENDVDKVLDGKNMKNVPAIWLTNLDIPKRHEDIILFREYSPEAYPKYDNYDAINVDKVADIPKDYDGVIGVPVTFLDKYNPEQFEILGIAQGAESLAGPSYLGVIPYLKYEGGKARAYVNGQSIYTRILIHNISKHE